MLCHSQNENDCVVVGPTRSYVPHNHAIVFVPYLHRLQFYLKLDNYIS